MSAHGNQVKNGKAFEYSILSQYHKYLRSLDLVACVIKDKAYETAKGFYDEQPQDEKEKFDESARATIDTIVMLEPGLTSQKDDSDVLNISLALDADGEAGDVRDVIFSRPNAKWQMGFSAKNNHEAIKHSRLSNQIDFGQAWLGSPCSHEYWQEIHPIFEKVLLYQSECKTWNDIANKSKEIYVPILQAFKSEMIRLCGEDAKMPGMLVKYLIGKYPFYKITKEDRYNLVSVKAFNIDNELNKSVNGKIARYKTPKLNLPTRIVELDFKKNSETTLVMILDQGWEISFRIHNAETKIVPSLKFDIQLLGNPPILFTQHLFQ